MKKQVLFLALILFSAVSIQAQSKFFGGSFGFDYKDGSYKSSNSSSSVNSPSTLSMNLYPVFGKYVLPRLVVGGEAGLGFSVYDPKSSGSEVQVDFRIGAMPFVRFCLLQRGDFGFWLKGGIPVYFTIDDNGTDTNPVTVDAGLFVKPLLTYSMSDRWQLELSSDLMGFGYKVSATSKNETTTTYNYLGFGVNSGSSTVSSNFGSALKLGIVHLF
ncbi:MAG: hypothetical protein LBS54_05875 [Dysgonamonadaceae bacterium]|jgi:hypothetical protein|nr:hypothetical protein [Dysgonamonadaceae bacterium]